MARIALFQSCTGTIPAANAQALVAAALSILALGFVVAYGWSEQGLGSPIELLIPVRLD